MEMRGMEEDMDMGTDMGTDIVVEKSRRAEEVVGS
jgi:hypothetical protein